MNGERLKVNGKRSKRGLLLLALAYILLACTSGCLVNKIAFQPDKLGPAWTPTHGEEFYFDGGENNGRLHGVLLTAPAPRAVVVYMHGNGGNVAGAEWLGNDIRQNLNTTVFVWDYPGYGKSEGTPTPKSVLTAGRAAVTFAAELTDTPPTELIIIGRSMGTSIATDAALHTNARALVLESGFTSLKAMCARALPILPWGWILPEPMEVEGKVARFNGAVFIAHGTADTTVPYRFGERLYAAAPEPKAFFRADGNKHNDHWPPAYWRELERFLFHTEK